MRDTRERLLDMQEALERIFRYTDSGREEFDRNELVQTWVVHHLEIIGEAARVVPDDFREANPEMPWRQIVAMRDILVHHYFGIDKEAVWSFVQRDLPALQKQLATILAKESP